MRGSILGIPLWLWIIAAVIIIYYVSKKKETVSVMAGSKTVNTPVKKDELTVLKTSKQTKAVKTIV